MSAFSSLDQQAQENERLEESVDSKDKGSTHAPAPISVSLSLAAAIRAHKKGKMEKAVQIYSSILRKYPDNPDANYLLGVAAFERGLRDDAVAMIERAIACEPDNAAYHGKLGEILTLLGQVDKAGEAYQRAADLAPDDVRFHLGRAQILERNGDLEGALRQYRHIVESWPDAPEALYRCATLEARLGDRSKAQQHVRQALSVKSDYSDAHFLYALLNVGQGQQTKARQHFLAASRFGETRADLHLKVATKLLQLNDLEGAVVTLRREVKVNPNSFEAYCLLGECLVKREELDGALLAFERAISINPNFTRAYSQYGLALLHMGQKEEAIRQCQVALHVSPNDAAALCAYAVVLREDDKINEAIDQLLKAIHLAPDLIDAKVQLGHCYMESLQLGAALKQYDKAIEMDGRDANLKLMRAQCLLQSEKWAQGWKAYEIRRKLSGGQSESDASLWDGGVQADKRVLLTAEGSKSDVLMFARYVAEVADKVRDVYIACPKDMARLFAAMEGVSGVVPADTPLPRHDFQLPLKSLPYVLKAGSPSDQDFKPYLSAASKDVQLWQDRLSRDSSGLNVGLVWQGDRQFKADRKRSPGIWPFSRLFYMRDIEFYGLQVGDGSDVLSDPQLSKVVKNYGIDLLDFADTAALVEALDLVITCDTAIAHLCGAMGKPVWVVLPYGCDWRWGKPEAGVGQQSAWYPSMTLYRQSESGDWADVFARLGVELDAFKANR